MNTEFHYYVTRLVAARAGLPPREARIIAWSSQYTDDNSTVFQIDGDLPTAYGNYISQTMDILKPRETLMRIYALFHFIPGNPAAAPARRRDGAMHRLNTTPDSKNANRVLDAALASGDPYRIGIACHGYADTWAHQNFVGYGHAFNAMTAALGALFHIGHAGAQHAPDRVSHVWTDKRLIAGRIDNNARFIRAAACMLRKLARYADPRISGKELHRRAIGLKKDLARCFGDEDPANTKEALRIARYRELSRTPGYGGCEMEPYDARSWMDEAVTETVRGLRDRSDSIFARLDPLTDVYTWKDRENYKQTHWYRFQEAVKAHQRETWQILAERNFKGLELPKL